MTGIRSQVRFFLQFFRKSMPSILGMFTSHIIILTVFCSNLFKANPSVSTVVGRPGMALWKIFVLATLKLGLNCDFDRLQELANEHNTIRQILGHADWADTTRYKLPTIIDNVSKLKPLDSLISIKSLLKRAMTW